MEKAIVKSLYSIVDYLVFSGGFWPLCGGVDGVRGDRFGSVDDDLRLDVDGDSVKEESVDEVRASGNNDDIGGCCVDDDLVKEESVDKVRTGGNNDDSFGGCCVVGDSVRAGGKRLVIFGDF